MTRYEALVAALDAQAEAKKAYYAEPKVANWRPLYDALRAANSEVIKAARAYVKATNGGGDGGNRAGSQQQVLGVAGEEYQDLYERLRAS